MNELRRGAMAIPGETTAATWAPMPRNQAVARTASLPLRGAEWLFGLAAIFILTGALFTLLDIQGTLGMDPEALSSTELDDFGDPTRRKVFYGVYGVMSAFVLLRWKSFLAIVRGQPVVLALILLGLISASWSDIPDLTVRRGIALTLTTSLGWYFAARYGLLALLRIFAYGLGATLVVSAFLGLVLPEYGIATGVHEGAWKGAFSHKNTLGKIAALSAWTFALLWKAEASRRWLPGVGFVLAVAMLALSTSLTAVIVLLMMLSLMPFAGVVRWRLSRGAPVLMAGLLIGGSALLLVTSELDMALTAVGRDPTLSGRTALWGGVVAIGMERPWLGAGYGAFWSGDDAWLVRRAAGWGANGSHNGFLDVWLDLGFAGLLFAIVAMLIAFRRSLRVLRTVPGAAAAWPILCLAFVLLSNLAESGLLAQNNLIWVLFVVGATAGHHELRRHRAAEQAIAAGISARVDARSLPTPDDRGLRRRSSAV